jgi:hypothetical protein
VQLPPDIIARLAIFFTTRLLQHYALYSYAFTQQQQHIQHEHQLLVSCNANM